MTWHLKVGLLPISSHLASRSILSPIATKQSSSSLGVSLVPPRSLSKIGVDLYFFVALVSSPHEGSGMAP